MPTPFTQQGALLQISISGTMTTIPYRRKITPPGQKRAEIDTTDLDSTANTSFPDPVVDNGSFALEFNWNPTNTVQAYIRSSFTNGTTSESMQWALANGTAYPFTAWVSDFQGGDAAPHAGQPQTATATFRVSGAM